MIYERGKQMVDFNQRVVDWQLQQMTAAQKQMRDQTDLMMTMSFNGMKMTMDAMMSAQNTMLAAFTPETSSKTTKK
ncbi:MAG: hypothetical protein AAFV53_05705 [Myxococcota bacterium]